MLGCSRSAGEGETERRDWNVLDGVGGKGGWRKGDGESPRAEIIVVIVQKNDIVEKSETVINYHIGF